MVKNIYNFNQKFQAENSKTDKFYVYIQKIEENAFAPVLARHNLWNPSDVISMSKLWEAKKNDFSVVLINSTLTQAEGWRTAS